MFRRRPRQKETLSTTSVIAETDRVPSKLEKALLTLETAALAAYTRFGLPDRPGHYSRAPGDNTWTFLADALSPEEKWALLERQPLGKGWRYADLSALGSDSQVAQVRVASKVLVGCAALRRRACERGYLNADDMADAIRLGALWGWIAPTSEPLIEPE